MEHLFGTLTVFAICMGGMFLTTYLSGRKLKGSCGISSELEGLDLSCGVCPKVEADVCPSSEENGDLIRMATLGNPRK